MVKTVENGVPAIVLKMAGWVLLYADDKVTVCNI